MGWHVWSERIDITNSYSNSDIEMSWPTAHSTIIVSQQNIWYRTDHKKWIVNKTKSMFIRVISNRLLFTLQWIDFKNL